MALKFLWHLNLLNELLSIKYYLTKVLTRFGQLNFK